MYVCMYVWGVASLVVADCTLSMTRLNLTLIPTRLCVHRSLHGNAQTTKFCQRHRKKVQSKGGRMGKFMVCCKTCSVTTFSPNSKELTSRGAREKQLRIPLQSGITELWHNTGQQRCWHILPAQEITPTTSEYKVDRSIFLAYSQWIPNTFSTFKNFTLQAPKATSGDGYIDEMEEPEVAQYSDVMKRKFRAEYLGVGGDVNQKMPNYALWISVVITILALATWASGGCY